MMCWFFILLSFFFLPFSSFADEECYEIPCKVSILLDERQNDYQFLGKVDTLWRNGNAYEINKLTIEDFLFTLLSNRVHQNLPLEAAKALAIVMRTDCYNQLLTRFSENWTSRASEIGYRGFKRGKIKHPILKKAVINSVDIILCKPLVDKKPPELLNITWDRDEDGEGEWELPETLPDELSFSLAPSSPLPTMELSPFYFSLSKAKALGNQGYDAAEILAEQVADAELLSLEFLHEHGEAIQIKNH